MVMIAHRLFVVLENQSLLFESVPQFYVFPGGRGEFFIEEAVSPLGYVHVPEHDMPGRLNFVKRTDDDKSTHHLNITELGTECWSTHGAFRDYLCACPEAMEQYGELKQDLAGRHQQDRPAYLAGKAPFIGRILELAREAGMGAHDGH